MLENNLKVEYLSNPALSYRKGKWQPNIFKNVYWYNSGHEKKRLGHEIFKNVYSYNSGHEKKTKKVRPRDF